MHSCASADLEPPQAGHRPATSAVLAGSQPEGPCWACISWASLGTRLVQAGQAQPQTPRRDSLCLVSLVIDDRDVTDAFTGDWSTQGGQSHVWTWPCLSPSEDTQPWTLGFVLNPFPSHSSWSLHTSASPVTRACTSPHLPRGGEQCRVCPTCVGTACVDRRRYR